MTTLDGVFFVEGISVSIATVSGKSCRWGWSANVLGPEGYVAAACVYSRHRCQRKFWGPPVTVAANDTGDIVQSSMAVVNGNPAISYFDNAIPGVRYVRANDANDANGAAWGTPTTVEGGPGFVIGVFPSLAVVDGTPAISYQDATNGNLKYAHATDANGSEWGSVVTIATGNVGQYTSLAVTTVTRPSAITMQTMVI